MKSTPTREGSTTIVSIRRLGIVSGLHPVTITNSAAAIDGNKKNTQLHAGPG